MIYFPPLVFKLNIQYCHDLFVLLNRLFFIFWTKKTIEKRIKICREKESDAQYVAYYKTHTYMGRVIY